ncbi:hypothetical protein HYX12_00840 [Candidatus Woesearchaeota archaeon]|nr:hypothetical protein [Candidatus Woesearchaeota archaeon]
MTTTTLDKRTKKLLNSKEWHEQIWINTCHFESYAIDAVAQILLFRKAREFLREGIPVEQLREEYNLLPVISSEQMEVIDELYKTHLQEARDKSSTIEKEYYAANPEHPRSIDVPFEVKEKIREECLKISDINRREVTRVSPYYYTIQPHRGPDGEGICRMVELKRLVETDDLFVPKVRLTNRPYVTILDPDDLNSPGAYDGRLHQLCLPDRSKPYTQKDLDRKELKLRRYSSRYFDYSMAYEDLKLSDFADPGFLNRAELMERTIFESECRSWYMIATGKLPSRWGKPLDLSGLDDPTARLIEYYSSIVTESS